MAHRRLAFILAGLTGLAGLVLAPALVAADAPTPPPPLPLPPDAKSPPTQVLVLGWTDADSERAATALVAAVAKSAWVARFTRLHKRVPRLLLRGVRNRTGGHVNTRLLERLLDQKIATSIRVKPVAKGIAGRFSEDLLVSVWMIGQNDRSGGTLLDSTLLSLVGQDPSSGHEVVRALYERRKLIVMPPTTAHAVPGKPAPPPGQPKITPLKPGQVVDLSGLFNDVDARTLARAAIADARSSRWLKAAKTRPILKLYRIRNRTMEHAPLQSLSERLAAGLLQSGKVRLQGRGGTAPPFDPKNTFVVSGYLTSQVSALDAKRTLRVYRLNLEAVSADSQAKAWIFSRTIKKIVETKTATATSKKATKG